MSPEFFRDNRQKVYENVKHTWRRSREYFVKYITLSSESLILHEYLHKIKEFIDSEAFSITLVLHLIS